MAQDHLCVLFNRGLFSEDKEAYKKLVRNARFICRNCGRVAHLAEFLCNPEKLDQ